MPKNLCYFTELLAVLAGKMRMLASHLQRLVEGIVLEVL